MDTCYVNLNVLHSSLKAPEPIKSNTLLPYFPMDMEVRIVKNTITDLQVLKHNLTSPTTLVIHQEEQQVLKEIQDVNVEEWSSTEEEFEGFTQDDKDQNYNNSKTTDVDFEKSDVDDTEEIEDEIEDEDDQTTIVDEKEEKTSIDDKTGSEKENEDE